MLARRAELRDDVPHADEATFACGIFLQTVVGEVDGQRRAAAEADDVDDGVAGRQVVCDAPVRVLQAGMAADAEGLGNRLTRSVCASMPMPSR